MMAWHRAWRSGGLVVLVGLAAGCNSSPPVAEPQPPPVRVSKPLDRKVPDYDHYDGRIAAVETVELRARIRGHLIKVNFQDGQMVKKGDLLYEIDPDTFQAQLESAQAEQLVQESQRKMARLEYERGKNIKADNAGAISQSDLDKRETDLARGEAAVKVAQAKVKFAQTELAFTKIYAPISGKISRTQVTPGNLVNAGGGEQLLTTITSVEPMHVYFDVDEHSVDRYRRDFRKGKDGNDNAPLPQVKDLKIPIDVAVASEAGFPHHGVIDFADNRVNPGTGTMQLRGVLPNAQRLLDGGMRARVRVRVSDPNKVLMVTERAIGSDQGHKYVYVVNDQDIVERRDIELGRLVDGMQVIKEGLKPDDWVIVNGIQRVRDGMKVQPRRPSGSDAEQPAEPGQGTSTHKGS